MRILCFQITFSITKNLLQHAPILFIKSPNANKAKTVGSGCGLVGRAAASDTRGPQFESSHQQTFI